jgi:CheY-like chemotaxis protein
MGIRKVILVADDEELLLNMVRARLTDEGYEVLAATDGNDAIQVSRAHAGTIDLLLTDFNMPRLDGLSAYRQIKSERSLIKVLFMSGSDPKSSQLPPGLPFLSKPFDTASLCRKVSQLLENSARDRTDSLVSR